MALNHVGYCDLPRHAGPSGFDHAAIHRARSLLYVAHTANDAVDVVDTRAGRYLRSVAGLKGVAGALVDEEQDLVFTSNRGEDTVGILSPDSEDGIVKIGVGIRPNGLAYDPGRRILLCANVGDPSVPGSTTTTLIDVRGRSQLASVSVPGRTRWTVFDPEQLVFFVNIAEPAQIVAIDPRAAVIVKHIAIPDRGPHGLDIDTSQQRLYCACDDGKLVTLHSASGAVLDTLELSGAPDVISLNQPLAHLYVAVGDPGVIDVIDTARWRRLETIATERGAHTLAMDETLNHVYAFLPQTHRAAIFQDGR